MKDCTENLNCCDCENTEDGCGCRYCFSCNACQECLDENYDNCKYKED